MVKQITTILEKKQLILTALKEKPNCFTCSKINNFILMILMSSKELFTTRSQTLFKWRLKTVPG